MSTINRKVIKICKNKQNVNIIQEYLTKLEQDDEEEILDALAILHGAFCFYIKEGLWEKIETCPIKTEDNNGLKMEEKAEDMVNMWLYSSSKAFIEIVLGLFSSKSPLVQVKSLETLMSMLKIEAVQYSKLNFFNQFFIKIIKEMMLLIDNSNKLFLRFNKYLQFFDVQFYCLKNISSLLQKQNVVKVNATKSKSIIVNTHAMLQSITNQRKEAEEKKLFLPISSNTEIVTLYQNAFSTAWMALLQTPGIPIIVQKKILIELDSKIMPRLVAPKLLIDFLTDSYDAGGVVSLLALNGLFVLINQHNLDYPDFYVKLYNVLDASLFHVKYKTRFFYLLDLFLSSTYLPTYLVAAFLKKLARIALFAPIEDMEMLLVFVKNTLIRHPSSRILVHRKNAKSVEENLTTDPYDLDEMDPMKSNALKSCLWELNTLKSHYSSAVLKNVASFKKDFPVTTMDISESFDVDFEELFQSKLKEISGEKATPLNFIKEKVLFSELDSTMWKLE